MGLFKTKVASPVELLNLFKRQETPRGEVIIVTIVWVIILNYLMLMLRIQVIINKYGNLKCGAELKKLSLKLI